MSRRTLLNFFLLGIIMVLTALLFITEQPVLEGEMATFPGITPETVNSITLKQDGEASVVFNKADGDWMMTAPYTVSASPFRVTAMLQLLQESSHIQLTVKGQDLAIFKLEHPTLVLTFNERQFAFGDRDPIDKLRYVRYGDTIYLIKDTLFPQLLQPPEFFINSRLLPEGTRLKRVEFPDYELIKRNGEWRIEPELEISADEINRLIDGWLNASAMRVSPATQTQFAETITVETERDETIRFNIIAGPDELILVRPDLGIQYHLHNQTAEYLYPREINANRD